MAARVILHCFYSGSATSHSSASEQRGNLRKKGAAFISSNANQRQAPNSNSSSIARALISYVEAGKMAEALTLFRSLKNPKNFHWNVMIRGYSNNGEHEEVISFHDQMLHAGNLPDNFTFPSVIKSCTKLQSFGLGLKIHGQLFKLGLSPDLYICNSLIAMYSKLGLLDPAEKLFVEMTARDVVSWNAMIDGYASNGEGLKSLSLFRNMQEDFGVKPDEIGVMSAIEACCKLLLPKQGKELHCYLTRRCFESEIKVVTTLLDLYCNCGGNGMIYAERLFDMISKKNVVVWNVMMNGYFLSNLPEKAIASLMKMQEAGLEPDAITMVNLLPSLTQLSSSHGKSAHGIAIRKGLLPHLVLETVLTLMYAKTGELRSAKLSFDMMLEKSLVSWNAMISACVQNGKSMEAMKLFSELLMEEPLLKPDAFTISSIIPACSQLTSLQLGKQIHGYAFKSSFEPNTLIQNSIMYMYAKCGDLKSATKVFDTMLLCRDVVTWNTVILAYALHGHGKAALDTFSDMIKRGFEPNASTFLSVLSACSVSGFIDEGWKHFKIMQREHELDPQADHFGCMIDLLGRAGDLGKAMDFIERLPVPPTSRIWGSLLTAGRNNNSIEVAEYAAERIFQMSHDNTGCCILLQAMYAKAGRWEDAERVRSLMKEDGLHRTKGRSFVELNCKSCNFAEGERSHEEIDTIQLVSDILSRQIGEGDDGRVSMREVVINKLRPPNRHSVRLAVCFGLISSAVGTPVLVKKNVRVCDDCHGAMKMISSFTGREIVVGDSSFYHHFNNGMCCCGDYW